MVILMSQGLDPPTRTLSQLTELRELQTAWKELEQGRASDLGRQEDARACKPAVRTLRLHQNQNRAMTS